MQAVKNEKLQAHITPVLMQRVRQLAEEDRRTVSQMAGLLLEEALEAREANKTQG